MKIIKLMILISFLTFLTGCTMTEKNPAPSSTSISLTSEEESLKKNYQPGDLAKAAYNGDTEKVKAYLKIGINVNERDKPGGTALHAAMFQKNIEVTNLLIQHKADVNIQGLSNHFTPLHDAVWANNLPAAEALLKAGADPTIKNNKGQTPLEKAKIEGRIDMIKLLEASKKN